MDKGAARGKPPAEPASGAGLKSVDRHVAGKEAPGQPCVIVDGREVHRAAQAPSARGGAFETRDPALHVG